MIDTELSAIAAQGITSLVKIYAVRIQNAIRNIVALCTAHRKEDAVLQFEHLPANQVNDLRTDFVCFSTVPLFHGIFVQSIEIFVITVHKKDSKRQGFQPVELRIIAFVTVPDTSEVAADDHVIVFRHSRLLRKVLWLKPKWIFVKITGCIDYFHRSNRCLMSAPPLIRTRISSVERTATRYTV